MFQDQSSKSTPANSYYVPMVVEQDAAANEPLTFTPVS